jgi:hypothetical protein
MTTKGFDDWSFLASFVLLLRRVLSDLIGSFVSWEGKGDRLVGIGPCCYEQTGVTIIDNSVLGGWDHISYNTRCPLDCVSGMSVSILPAGVVCDKYGDRDWESRGKC